MSVQTVKDKPIFIGLTGGIASGKTTAANYFKKRLIPVIDSDQIVFNLWENNQELKDLVFKHFNIVIQTKADKKKLAEIIFSDPNQRELLNRLVHPFVFEQIEVEKVNYKKMPLVVIDMPLLFEANYQRFIDYAVVVYVDRNTQIKRLMERSHLTYENAIKRIESQMSLDEKAKKADVILNNKYSVEQLYQEIDQFLMRFQYEK